MSISTSAAARLAKVLPSLDSISISQLTTKPQLKSYFVPRTSQGNLPVYKTYRSQAVYTDIKRIQGNVVQFRNDLQELLPQIKKENFNCHVINGSLRIKGDHSQIIKEILDKKF
jgi:large subunit ribosomal protein L49